MISFETNEFYSAGISKELLFVVERSPNIVTFRRESGAEYTVKIDTIIKTDIPTGKKYYIEAAAVVPNMVHVTAEDVYK